MSDRKLPTAKASLHCITRRYVEDMQVGYQNSAIIYCRAKYRGVGLQITCMALG